MSSYDSMEQPSPDPGGGNLERHAENFKHIGDTVENAYDESDRKANGMAEVDAHIIGRQLKPLADAEGVSVPQGMAALARQHAVMRYGDPETKRQAWIQSTDHYGVVPHVVQQGLDAQETDARLNAALANPDDPYHEHATALVNQDWADRQVGPYVAKVSNLENQINGFARAHDGKGNLAHPHFSEVYEDMIGIAEATAARGKQPHLETVYRQALLENPKFHNAEAVRRARQGAVQVSGSGGADTGHGGRGQRRPRLDPQRAGGLDGGAGRGSREGDARTAARGPGERGTPRARAFARRRASASPRADPWHRPGRR